MRAGVPALRLVLVGVVAVAVQYAVLDELDINGYRPQLVLALAACCGAGGGAQRGALAGFALGVMFDLRGPDVVGVNALAYMLAGLVAGYVLTLTPDPQWWLAGLFATVGAAVGQLAVPGIKQVIGDEGWLDTRALWSLVVVVPFAAVLTPALVPLGRWCTGIKRRKWKAMIE